MSVKNLIVQAPILCGAYNAEKHSKVNKIIFEHEMEHNSFPKTDDEDAYDRIAFLFDWECEDEDKKNYCLNLATLNVMKHYENNHKSIETLEESEDLKAGLIVDESDYPDVAKVLSVQAASTGWWGD